MRDVDIEVRSAVGYVVFLRTFWIGNGGIRRVRALRQTGRIDGGSRCIYARQLATGKRPRIFQGVLRVEVRARGSHRDRLAHHDRRRSGGAGCRTRNGWLASEIDYHATEIAPAILIGGQISGAVKVCVQIAELKGTQGKSPAHSNVESYAGISRKRIVGTGFADVR